MKPKVSCTLPDTILYPRLLALFKDVNASFLIPFLNKINIFIVSKGVLRFNGSQIRCIVPLNCKLPASSVCLLLWKRRHDGLVVPKMAIIMMKMKGKWGILIS
jgi:hypothetical protein